MVDGGNLAPLRIPRNVVITGVKAISGAKFLSCTGPRV